MENVIYSHSLPKGIFKVFHTRPDFHFHEVKQVHGINCSYPSSTMVEADGIIQDSKDPTPLLIKTADCLPIIFEGLTENVFLHAGWRGLALGILDIPELKKIKPQTCFIGPCILSCCFEVGQDFNDLFPEVTLIKKDDKFFADLISFAKEKILDLFPEIHISKAGICTMCNEDFHSFRRNKTTHRNFNVYFSKD
ncbi:MAG: polyphenol oxidase family protein [Bacteriovoracaceae bacterium]